MSKRAKILLTGLALIVFGIAIFQWFPFTGLLTIVAGMLMISEIWVLWIAPNAKLWSWGKTIAVLGLFLIIGLTFEAIKRYTLG